MDARSSRPEEQPPRRHGGRLAWLTGVPAALVALALVLVVVVVVVVVLAG